MDISCLLKMLNAYLYNAQYKHLTYIYLISQNSYSPTKNVSMTAEIRDDIFALKCYMIIRRSLIHRASETYP